MGRNLLSVDVEDWFHAHNLRGGVDWKAWDQYETRVVGNTERVLDLLDRHDTAATFFVLGWVAEREPALVREIERRGHEVASHGYNHELLTAQSLDEVESDLRRSLEVLEPLVDGPIRGYRAPSFSITDGAIDILADLGFDYDSSLVATGVHDRYGSLTGPEAVSRSERPGGLNELQLPTLDLPGVSVPWGGGGYFRVIPYPVYRRGVERLADSEHFVFYCHPWEFDPDQPRIDVAPAKRFRHYTNLSRTEVKFDRLLEEFDWEPLGDAIGHENHDESA